jgi:2,3-bisphosphoglycerate-independent phosphoglycerate mutase
MVSLRGGDEQELLNSMHREDVDYRDAYVLIALEDGYDLDAVMSFLPQRFHKNAPYVKYRAQSKRVKNEHFKEVYNTLRNILKQEQINERNEMQHIKALEDMMVSRYFGKANQALYKKMTFESERYFDFDKAGTTNHYSGN